MTTVNTLEKAFASAQVICSLYSSNIKVYSEVNGIYGYRRIMLNVNRILESPYNHKRIYRLMKSVNLTSVIRKKRKRYIHSTSQITAENILNREFTADRPNEKLVN